MKLTTTTPAAAAAKIMGRGKDRHGVKGVNIHTFSNDVFV